MGKRVRDYVREWVGLDSSERFMEYCGDMKGRTSDLLNDYIGGMTCVSMNKSRRKGHYVVTTRIDGSSFSTRALNCVRALRMADELSSYIKKGVGACVLEGVDSSNFGKIFSEFYRKEILGI